MLHDRDERITPCCRTESVRYIWKAHSEGKLLELSERRWSTVRHTWRCGPRCNWIKKYNWKYTNLKSSGRSSCWKLVIMCAHAFPCKSACKHVTNDMYYTLDMHTTGEGMTCMHLHQPLFESWPALQWRETRSTINIPWQHTYYKRFPDMSTGQV